MSVCGFIREAFDWSNLKTNGNSYDYATNCDFPGENNIGNNNWQTYTVKQNDQLGATRFCADLCSKDNDCTAFIAMKKNNGYWSCGLKQGDTNTFTRDSARIFKKKDYISACGFLVVDGDDGEYWRQK